MNIVDQQAFRDVMSCMGVAANIITMGGPVGYAGFTVSVVCSVTDTPSTLLMYLNHGASIWSVFNENRTLHVDILSVGREPFLNPFGDRTPTEHRFAATRWQTGVTGCPQLEETPVSLDYRISQVVSVDTHGILFCAIEAIYRHATPHGLTWFGRSYHVLMRPACQPP